VPVVHACILADQEDHGPKPTMGKQLTKPYLEITDHKNGLVEWLKVQALNSSSSTAKKILLSSFW
jgi:hypothetical protein